MFNAKIYIYIYIMYKSRRHELVNECLSVPLSFVAKLLLLLGQEKRCLIFLPFALCSWRSGWPCSLLLCFCALFLVKRELKRETQTQCLCIYRGMSWTGFQIAGILWHWMDVTSMILSIWFRASQAPVCLFGVPIIWY
jgi:hypothetical protein